MKRKTNDRVMNDIGKEIKYGKILIKTKQLGE